MTSTFVDVTRFYRFLKILVNYKQSIGVKKCLMYITQIGHGPEVQNHAKNLVILVQISYCPSSMKSIF